VSRKNLAELLSRETPLPLAASVWFRRLKDWSKSHPKREKENFGSAIEHQLAAARYRTLCRVFSLSKAPKNLNVWSISRCQ
jgi:hypothetical protein